ncbi:MAG: hypothetical protein K2G31_01275 [Clostridia bacterium]|nr:hypothetical protein [Clostridia bacterium]
MKKYFNNKQIALSAVVLIAVILIAVLSLSVSMPTVAYAYEAGEIYYAGSGTFTKETESFSYATKTTESYSINPSYPEYYNCNDSLQNTCANVAGANIIGYYDRFYDNLIPDYEAGILRNDFYIYFPMGYYGAKKQAVIDELYQRMQTNVSNAGSTQAQYKNGLSSYVQSKNLSISFSGVMTNGSFDLEKAKAQFKNGNPLSLYLSGYSFTMVTDSGSTVMWDKFLYNDNHIAIAYGYEKVSYFDASGKVIRTETYLKVATGFGSVSGVYIVNKYGALNDAEAVHIA